MVSAPTVPYCGACGYDIHRNVNDDIFCDSCGSDLTPFGFTGLFPPTNLVATAGSLSVTFTWDTALDTSDLEYQINGGPFVLVTGANPAGEIVAALEGDKVAGRVRYVLNGVNGLWSGFTAANALA